MEQIACFETLMFCLMKKSQEQNRIIWKQNLKTIRRQ